MENEGQVDKYNVHVCTQGQIKQKLAEALKERCLVWSQFGLVQQDELKKTIQYNATKLTCDNCL